MSSASVPILTITLTDPNESFVAEAIEQIVRAGGGEIVFQTKGVHSHGGIPLPEEADKLAGMAYGDALVTRNNTIVRLRTINSFSYESYNSVRMVRFKKTCNCYCSGDVNVASPALRVTIKPVAEPFPLSHVYGK